MSELGDAISKLLPTEKLYDDAVSPLAKQIGRIGGDAGKVARLVLFPLQGLAHLQDRLDRMFERMANRVPTERRTEVRPEIAGPALETMAHLDDRGELWRLLEEILTKAMDSETVRLVHPAFTIIAKQLTPDEVRILFRLDEGSIHVDDTMDLDLKEQRFINRTVRSTGLDIELIVPSQFELFVYHLQALGLVAWQITAQTPLSYDDGVQKGISRSSRIELTDFGRLFVEAGKVRTIDMDAAG